MRILAFYHIKGGVGKTATAVNLSYVAAKSGAKTLICDLDPQGSASFYFRIKPKFKSGAKGLIKGGKRIDRNIKGTDYENLDLLPADLSFRNLDINLANLKRSKRRLNEILAPLSNEYEYIFLDCPPNITIVSENVFDAADSIIVPVIPTTLSQKTFEQLYAFFKAKKYRTKKLSAFFSMVETRKKLHQETMVTLSEKFGKTILNSRIPYLSQIERMGVIRKPVTAAFPRSKAAQKYRVLWKEIE
ncbi:MAG: ParA family protein [bacterium]